MANRFLDTNYYKSPFVRGLKGSLKSLYSFIICDCDGAGIWNLDLQAASLYTGFEISQLEFDEHFVKTGKAIPISSGKFFFPDFIEHQYPSGLQDTNTAHKNFIKTLKKFDLLDESLNVKKNGAKKGLESLISQGNGLSNDKGLGSGNVLSQQEKKDMGRGVVVYNAEEEVLKNQKEFERICMAASQNSAQGKESLHKYHLWLESNEKYPKGRKAVFSGFEGWLLNEKKFNNGTKTIGNFGKKPVPQVNPEGGFGKL